VSLAAITMWYLMLACTTWSACLALPGAQVSSSPYNPDNPNPYISCSFNAPCDGFITSLGNDFNQPTDVAWQRDDHLKTTDKKADGRFLRVFHDATSGPVTARMRTPPLGITGTGCFYMQFYTTNATLNVLDAATSDRIMGYETNVGTSWIQAPIILLNVSGPLLLEAVLPAGREAELAVDTVRVYSQHCQQVEWQWEDEDWPPSATWPTEQPQVATTPAGGHQETTTPGAASSPAASGAILTLLAVTAALLTR